MMRFHMKTNLFAPTRHNNHQHVTYQWHRQSPKIKCCYKCGHADVQATNIKIMQVQHGCRILHFMACETWTHNKYIVHHNQIINCWNCSV